MKRPMDFILNTMTYFFSSFGYIILFAILIFIFSKGLTALTWDLLVSDYHQQTWNTYLTEDIFFPSYEDPQLEGSYFSAQWGVALQDDINNENTAIVRVVYVDSNSPFKNMNQVGTMNYITIEEGQQLQKVLLENEGGDLIVALEKQGAQMMATLLDQGNQITEMITTTDGKGIRGSLLTTLLLIITTLLMVLPLGVGAAIYLSEFAINNVITKTMRSLIEMMSGIPSIVFGLIGAIVFIPFFDGLGVTNGGSILSGAATLTIMLLPIVIRTTEEGLKMIPASYRQASLALGASRVQTTFKVILPNAMGSILTAVLLAIGRIIGESAALIYAIGTVIKDEIRMNDKGTSLAVHIWSIMSGETPNFELASAISIIILITVLLLSITIKVISKRWNRMEV